MVDVDGDGVAFGQSHRGEEVPANTAKLYGNGSRIESLGMSSIAQTKERVSGAVDRISGVPSLTLCLFPFFSGTRGPRGPDQPVY